MRTRISRIDFHKQKNLKQIAKPIVLLITSVEQAFFIESELIRPERRGEIYPDIPFRAKGEDDVWGNYYFSTVMKKMSYKKNPHL